MTPPTSRTSPIDVLIIGAGPAGLATSQGLARLQYKCIVFSNSKFRNERSRHMHGVPTWEHKDPADFRAATRKDILANYDTTFFEDVGIKSLEKSERERGGTLFKAIDENGKEWWGRKVVLAVGIKDVMLDIEGYDECWARGIFHCLFCHGYEERGGASAGVFAIDDCSPAPTAVHLARFALRLADNVTIYTNGKEEVSKGIKEIISKAGAATKTKNNIFIEGRKIKKLVKGPRNADVEVELEDGTKKVESLIAHKPKGVLNGPFVDQLGLEITPQGGIKVNPPFNETSVSGTFASGDCGTPMQAVAIAISMGAFNAAGAAASLAADD